MSEPNPELIKKYIQFQMKIQSILPALDEIAGKGGMGESLAPAIDSLKKVAAPEQDLSKVTAPHIALNSGEIQRISGNIVMAMQAIPATGAEGSGLPDIKSVPGEAKVLVGMAEEDTTQDDINAKATDYLLTAIESQTAAKELEVMVRDLERGMRNEEEGKAAENEGLNERIASIIISAREKVRNFLGRLAGRAKQYGQDLKAALESIPEKLEETGKNLIDRVARLLKKVLEKLSQFMAALIGAMFDFAAWVQSIATKKSFTIKDFEIQIPSSEIQITMVGPIPLPMPKFQTPSLTVSFGPKGPPD